MRYLLLLLFVVTCHSHAKDIFTPNSFEIIEEADGVLPSIVVTNSIIRESASKNSKKVGVISGGEVVHATFQRESEWTKLHYKGVEAYTHRDNLIKQIYYSDILYDVSSKNDISVVAMSGQYFSHLPGSFFVTLQSSAKGIASYGPLSGDCFEKPLFYKVKHSSVTAYFSLTYACGNRVNNIATLFIVNDEGFNVIEFPSFTASDNNLISLENDELEIEFNSYFSCCDVMVEKLSINLKTLAYEGYKSHITLPSGNVERSEAVELIVNKVEF